MLPTPYQPLPNTTYHVTPLGGLVTTTLETLQSVLQERVSNQDITPYQLQKSVTPRRLTTLCNNYAGALGSSFAVEEVYQWGFCKPITLVVYNNNEVYLTCNLEF